MIKTYQIKTSGGGVYIRKAKSLAELFKDIHLIYMNELGIDLGEFVSIKEVQEDDYLK